METVRKINDELAVAEQVTLEQLTQLKQQGFKSVINLRLPDEQGFLNNEQQHAESLGLYYINIPLKVETINDKITTYVFQQINNLPKPVIVHCNNAMRAAVVVMMHIAIRQGATLKQAFKQAEKLGLLGISTYK